jgi:hypothetical protein
MVVFHKCLIDFFDKIPSMHVGNTILVYHNLMRMMRSPIENVMLVEKWNCRVEIFLKYMMGEVLPYLEVLHSIGKYVFTFVKCKPSIDHGSILNFEDF